MNFISPFPEDITTVPQFTKYNIILKLVDLGECRNLVDCLKSAADEDIKCKIINVMISFAEFDKGRISLCESNICDIIVDILLSADTEDLIVGSSVLIGSLGISDKYRPVLFMNGISNIIVNALNKVENPKSKQKIIESIRRISSTRHNCQEIVSSGILKALADTLQKIDMLDMLDFKKDVSSYIYWIAYLTNIYDPIIQLGLIDAMYSAAELMPTKASQSHILSDMHFILKNKSDVCYKRYPVYHMWVTNFSKWLTYT